MVFDKMSFINRSMSSVSDLMFPTKSVTLLNFNITPSDWDYLASFSSTKSTVNQSDYVYKYCGNDFIEFRKWFVEFHGYLSVVVCLFGLITNILNIIVLTRKDMVSPTNAILTGLAITDMLVMVDYLPFTIYHYILKNQLDDCTQYSYSLSWMTLIHAHFSVLCHNVSIGLTVTLAVWRFIAVSYPQNNREWCSMYRAVMAIIICYIFIPIFTMPIFFCFEVKVKEKNSCCRDENSVPTVMTSSTSSAIGLTATSLGGGSRGASPTYNMEPMDRMDNSCCNCTLYNIQFSDVALENDHLLQKANFWIYSVLVKILPCIALTVLSLQLIQALYRTNRRRSQLKNRKCCNVDRSCDRTTRMLLAILLLFLITEFPQGILALLSGILEEEFYEICAQSFNEVVDILALINSAINFILYCVMSKQFRQTFRQLFTPKIINNWIAIQHEVTSTQATTCV